MAEVVGYTPLAVVPHRDILTEKKYLIRKHYKAWSLNPKALTLPLLTAILSYEVELYEKEGVTLARKRAS